MCWNDNHPSAVLCGSTTKTAALVDVEEDKILYQYCTQASVPLNGLLFAGNSCKVLTLSNNGSIELWDPKMKGSAIMRENNTTDYSATVNYAMDVCGSSYEDTKLTCVSIPDKQVVFYELRQWKKPFASIQLDHGQIGNNKHLSVKVK